MILVKIFFFILAYISLYIYRDGPVKCVFFVSGDDFGHVFGVCIVVFGDFVIRHCYIKRNSIDFDENDGFCYRLMYIYIYDFRHGVSEVQFETKSSMKF